jgi:hypothetical protein
MLTRADTNFESPFVKTAPMPKTNVALNLTQPLVFPGAPMGLKTMAKKPRNFGSNFTNSEIISKLEKDRQISNTLGVAVDFVAKKTPEPNSPSDLIQLSAGYSNKKLQDNLTPSADPDSDNQSPELPRLDLLDPRPDHLSNEGWAPLTLREPKSPNKLSDLSSVRMPKTPNSPDKP